MSGRVSASCEKAVANRVLVLFVLSACRTAGRMSLFTVSVRNSGTVIRERNEFVRFASRSVNP